MVPILHFICHFCFISDTKVWI